MVLYVFSDESGVFDKAHNNFYTYGGIICIGKECKDEWSRRYSTAEKCVGQHYRSGVEIKAAHITNKEKGKLYRSLNNCYKFGAVIHEQKVHEQVYASKKDKQRFLDFAYKISVKRAFESLIVQKKIMPDEITKLVFCVDEHTTATNGRYELREALEQEFRNGTFNWQYDRFFPPLFAKLKGVSLEYCNSEKKLLVRASDIVANNIYHHALNGEREKLMSTEYLCITHFPLSINNQMH